MATARARHSARVRARRRREQQRARRIAAIAVLALLGIAVLAVTVFDDSSTPTTVTPIETDVTATGEIRPRPEPLAKVGNLLIRLPVPAASVTAIGYHGADDGSVELQPLGRQANEGLLARLWRSIAGARTDGPRWYQLDGAPGTNVLDVGATEGTDVYAPVEGTVIAIDDVVIDGTRIGARIDIRPSLTPSVTVSIANVRPDPSLAVGTPVLASTSKLGTTANVAAVERQALAPHTRDDGNNVSIAVFPSPSALP
ncbi:MAG: hypothetical protein ACRC50_13270 [Gaiella sp.]